MTAPFSEAFAAPLALLHSPIFETTNDLTPLEIAFIRELQDRGARALARAGVRGRKYHRLRILGGQRDGTYSPPTLDHVYLTRHAFLGKHAGQRPHTMVQWKKEVLRRFAWSSELSAFVDAMVGKLDTLSPQDLGPEKGDRGLARWTALMKELGEMVKVFEITADRRREESGRLMELGERLEAGRAEAEGKMRKAQRDLHTIEEVKGVMARRA